MSVSPGGLDVGAASIGEAGANSVWGVVESGTDNGARVGEDSLKGVLEAALDGAGETSSTGGAMLSPSVGSVGSLLPLSKAAGADALPSETRGGGATGADAEAPVTPIVANPSGFAMTR